MRQATEWSSARVVRVTPLSPSVREIVLRPDTGVQPWAPGSHLPLRLPAQVAGDADERLDLRHYSLVTLTGRPEAEGYRIAVKRVDASRGGSRWMHGLREGDTIDIRAPHNHFALPPGAPPTLLVAGGIGITPLLGMALALLARGADVRMAYAVRNADELVYREPLRAALGERLSTFIGDTGQRLDLDRAIAALPAHAQALVCGPLTLMQAAQAAWARAGRPADALRIETFGSSGHRAAQAFRVRLPRHELTLEVPADRSLLEVLEANGVEVLSECRRGECGLCALDVLAVEAGEIDHRDLFFGAAEHAANRRLTSCVSRGCGAGATLVIDSAWRPDEPAPHAAPR